VIWQSTKDESMAWLLLLGSVFFAVLGQLFYKRYGQTKRWIWGSLLFCLKHLSVRDT